MSSCSHKNVQQEGVTLWGTAVVVKASLKTKPKIRDNHYLVATAMAIE
jgi:hypothetical protein